MKRSAWVAVAALSLLCTLWVPGAMGQAVYGSILGTVTDPSGAAVAGAKVTATSQTKNVSTEEKTNVFGAIGRWLAPSQMDRTVSLHSRAEGTVSHRGTDGLTTSSAPLPQTTSRKMWTAETCERVSKVGTLAGLGLAAAGIAAIVTLPLTGAVALFGAGVAAVVGGIVAGPVASYVADRRDPAWARFHSSQSASSRASVTPAGSFGRGDSDSAVTAIALASIAINLSTMNSINNS